MRGKRTLWIYMHGVTGAWGPLPARISAGGRRLTVSVPGWFISPVPGLTNALTDLALGLGRPYKRSLVRATGCPDAGQAITATVTAGVAQTVEALASCP